MIPTAPESILDEEGRPRTGAYSGAVASTCLAGLSTVSPLARMLGQKRWIFIGLYGPELIAGGCVVDMTYLASGFAFAFHRPTCTLLDHHSIGPRLRRGVPDSPLEGLARFAMPGASVEVDSRTGEGMRVLRVDMGRGARRLVMDLHVEDDARTTVPLSAVIALQGGRMNFTHKASGLPVRGEVRAGEAIWKVEGAMAAVDYTHGLPERETRWLWASAAGRTSGGRSIGFNLVEGWAPGADQENGAWVDGRLVKLGRASFARLEDRWEIDSDRLRVRFFPEGERKQDVDMKLVASRYRMPFGRFEGALLDEDGGTVTFDSVSGVTEEHDARW